MILCLVVWGIAFLTGEDIRSEKWTGLVGQLFENFLSGEVLFDDIVKQRSLECLGGAKLFVYFPKEKSGTLLITILRNENLSVRYSLGFKDKWFWCNYTLG